MSFMRDVMQRRRTTRRLRTEAVPDDMIQALLDAALAAPSAHNRQPWRYVLVRSEASRRSLALAMSVPFRADLSRDGLDQAAIGWRVEASIQRLTSAPLLVVACMTMADMDDYPDEGRQAAERNMAVQSVAASIQNLLLAAEELGLGAGWMCAPLFCQDVVRVNLGVPTDWEPQALIAVGWPAETPALPPRKARADLVVSR